MAVELMPVIEGGEVTCPCCGPRKTQLCGQWRIAVGFGLAALTKDGETVWQETNEHMWEDCMTVGEADAMAADDPDHDWRIILNGPLRGSTYQRHGDMQWLLIEKNDGFA